MTPPPSLAAHLRAAKTAPEPSGGPAAPGRSGMKRVTAVLTAEEHKRLKRLSVDQERSMEDILREAVSDLLARHKA